MTFFVKCKKCAHETGNPGMSDVPYGRYSYCTINGTMYQDSKFHCRAYMARAGREHYNKGNTFFRAGYFSEAIRWYIKAIDINKNDWQAHGNLSLAYLNARDAENTKKHLKIALKLNDNKQTRGIKAVIDKHIKNITND